jgi:hypothetical protein
MRGWTRKRAEPSQTPQMAPDNALAQPLVRASAYLGLYTYLSARHADTVVLTFAEIEALIGQSLPEAARREPAWWTPAGDSGASPVQVAAWTRAGRVVTPNLPAQRATFLRASDRT